MTAETFANIASELPQQPGIYKYYDINNNIIYVGKAKNLKKRISSYFNKNQQSFKTVELVQRINKIEFTIVNTEQDALLLENALIKEYRPKYNISLKDDKTYPYIVIKKEPFPRVFFTRKKYNDGSEYLGPFTSVFYVRELLSLIKQYVPLRNCKLNLTDKNINANKFKVCLEYHLGNCNGPCQGFQTAKQYAEGLQHLKEILKGNVSNVIKHYKTEMQQQVALLNFEKAEFIKKKIEHLQNYQAKSVVVSKNVTNADVFSILKEDDIAYVNYLMVNNGTIVQTHTQQLETKLDESEAETLSFAIAYFRDAFNSMSNEIIVPFEVDYPQTNIQQIVPKAGDKKKLLELSLKNVNYFKAELKRKKINQIINKTPEDLQEILQELQDQLQLKELPTHIECFDNSNFQGSFPVSACVCFRNAAPYKPDYRKFNIKTVSGINDFASMKETVMRHYKRYIQEGKNFPQLVIIDGGKGQLSAALEGIHEIGLKGKFTLIGLAKNEEELFFEGDQQSIKLDWNSEGLKLIRRIRDEVHRFGITFHRSQRSKGAIKNELENINGLGPNSITALLQQFKSIKKIKEQNLESLAKVIGEKKAKLLISSFSN
ncbi:MAG: excinuclease ABC subunit C [Chitinophagaceae bacterium]|nr:excinuclease ABC subunit C [Chitinophagaceae bacterium]